MKKILKLSGLMIIIVITILSVTPTTWATENADIEVKTYTYEELTKNKKVIKVGDGMTIVTDLDADLSEDRIANLTSIMEDILNNDIQ